MFELTEDETTALCIDIAGRTMRARELSAQWDLSVEQIKEFVSAHRERLEAMRARLDAGENPEEEAADSVSPQMLSELWITKKTERLKRLQVLADALYNEAASGNLSGADLSTAVREFRSYLTVAANELGQLMNRGSGEAVEGTSVQYTISGVDMDSMK